MMVAIAGAILALQPSGALRDVPPSACAPRPSDITLLWWSDGVRRPNAAGEMLRCVRTGTWALAMDAPRARLARLGPVRRRGGPAPTYARATETDDAFLSSVPAAEWDLSITTGGRTYRCVRGAGFEPHAGPRIVESGRLVQRADVTGLVFEDGKGRRLTADARVETTGWPDRLSVSLEAAPAPPAIVGGPSFGRVGGGWAFDGENHLEAPPAPDLEPERLTVDLWVYVPDVEPATRAHPWLFCANANEWAEGNFGLMLIDMVPTASLNVGGGRENCHLLQARRAARPERPDAPEPLLRLSRERWHHLAMTYDGADLRLYVDGVLRGVETIGRARVPGGRGIAIGRREDNAGDGYRFRGFLDEVRLTRRALSAEEIAERFARPEMAAGDPDVVRAWAFDPAGPSADRRPTVEWADGSLRIALRAGGRAFEAVRSLAPGERWRQGERKSISVALDPAALRTAPPAPSVRITATGVPDGGARNVVFDAGQGWHTVDLDGLEPVGEGNDSLERVRVVVENPDGSERPVRLLFATSASGFRVRGQLVPITGITAMLRDARGVPTGIPVQMSKNWHLQPDRDLVHQGQWMHAFALLRMPPRSRTVLELAIAYAHWGGVPAASHAQLCLIGWGSNQLWEQSALGAWGESICFEPDQAQAQCLICDVRPVMVRGMGGGQWGWTHNVGGGDILRLFDAKGQRVFPERMKTAFVRHGPCLSEVVHAGRLGETGIERCDTIHLYRTDDVVRGLYRIRMRVTRPVDFSRFVLFQIGADTYSYTAERLMAVGDERGLRREWATQWGGDAYRTEPIELTGRVPWVSLHQAVPQGDTAGGAWANRAVVVRAWRARLGGRPARPWLAERGARLGNRGTSTADLLPPPGVHRLLPGDYLDALVEHVVLPQRAGDYYGPNAALRAALERDGDTWRMAWREARGNDVAVTAHEGALLARRPLRLRAAGDRARFTLTGGLGYVPVTVAGLTAPGRPRVDVREGSGPWRRVGLSVHGNDGWQTDRAADGRSWEITVNLPADTPGDARVEREVRFLLEPSGPAPAERSKQGRRR